MAGFGISEKTTPYKKCQLGAIFGWRNFRRPGLECIGIIQRTRQLRVRRLLFSAFQAVQHIDAQ